MVAKPKPHNSGTMTKAAFFGMIRSALRRLSIRWRPRNDYLTSLRRAYTGTGTRSSWEYPCEQCGKWFIRAHMEVDHRTPCGTLREFDDIGPFCEKLFVEIHGWRALCKPCHLVRTLEERRKK